MSPTPSTTIMLMTGESKKMARPTKRDREIYLLSRRGWSDDALAAKYKLKPTTIKEGRDRYQIYRDSLAVDEQDLALAEMATRVMPKVEKVLTEAMKATRRMDVGRGKKVIMRNVADHDTRLKSVEMVRSFIEASRPKGGGITVNTQVNNRPGEAGQGGQSSRGFDFEARLRNIREKNGLTTGEEKIDDAEYEDVQSTAADELADIGIDLDDDDEDDLDDEEDEE